MLRIASHFQGQILNRNHGRETADSLRIRVGGVCDGDSPVFVNGAPAEMDGGRFSAEVVLRDRVNTVTASTLTRRGRFSQELTLLWDKASFRRYNFYLDDHSFLFTDLAKDSPSSAFEHFYLKALKRLHREYGMRVTLNCFYRNAHDAFELSQLPARWRGEFSDNADWLKFSFHAESEFPDRPYAEASAEEFGRDWDRVQSEIVRFAGEECYIPPAVIHWANVHPAVAAECIRRGVHNYFHSFRLRVMGGPSLQERQHGSEHSPRAQSTPAPTDTDTALSREELLGLGLHYGFEDEKSLLEKHIAYYDPQLDVVFFRNAACLNLVPLAEVRPRLETMFRLAEQTGAEAFSLASHEQYSFPYYPNYLPDHLQRIETAVRTFADYGYQSTFHNQGILGNQR